jgi:hypothetical protein
VSNLKLRIPDEWQGRVHSAHARYLLASFLKQPHDLPPDPGAGEARVSLSVPPRAIKILEGVTGDNPSVALRRLLASALPGLPQGMSVYKPLGSPSTILALPAMAAASPHVSERFLPARGTLPISPEEYWQRQERAEQAGGSSQPLHRLITTETLADRVAGVERGREVVVANQEGMSLLDWLSLLPGALLLGALVWAIFRKLAPSPSVSDLVLPSGGGVSVPRFKPWTPVVGG